MAFRILGPLEVADEGRAVKLGGAKQRALLALLLLHPNEVVSRDRLVDELWGDDVPETDPTAIQVHVSQLRKALGRDVIVTRAPGYFAQVEDAELDLSRFERLVADARMEEPPRAAELLREALAPLRSESEIRGTLRFLPQLEMRPSSNAPGPVESREAPPTSSFPGLSEPP